MSPTEQDMAFQKPLASRMSRDHWEVYPHNPWILCLGCRMKPLAEGWDGLGSQRSHLTVVDQEPWANQGPVP